MERASRLTLEQCKAGFKEVFQQLTHSHNFAEVWADFAELGAICIHQSAYFNPEWMPPELKEKALLLPIDEVFQALEERYLSLVPKYGKDGMTSISHLYAYTEYAVRTYRVDFLGPLYEELDLSGSAQRSKRGEFFTPLTIAQLMARLTLSEVGSIIEEKGYVTLQDPCVGAAGMVIAAAEQLASLGYDPRAMLLVEAIDVNKTFFNVAYLQLSALDIPARVWCGNTLSLQMQEYRETPQLKLSRFYWEQRPEFQMLKFIKTIDTQMASHQEAIVQPELEASNSESSVVPDIDPSGQFRLF